MGVKEVELEALTKQKLLKSNLIRVNQPLNTFAMSQDIKKLRKNRSPLPKGSEVIKLYSNRGYSAISFLGLVASVKNISRLFISSRNLSFKELEYIATYCEMGRIDNVNINVAMIDPKANYYDLAGKYKWSVKKTGTNLNYCIIESGEDRFVIESLNSIGRDPKSDVMTIYNNKEVFEFYEEIFENDFVINSRINKRKGGASDYKFRYKDVPFIIHKGKVVKDDNARKSDGVS